MALLADNLLASSITPYVRVRGLDAPAIDHPVFRTGFSPLPLQIEHQVSIIDGLKQETQHRGAGPTEALSRSRGGFTTKLNARCNARKLPLALILTPGQAHDQQGFGPMFQAISGRLDKLLADRGYDADEIRADIAHTGARSGDPGKTRETEPCQS